MKGLVISSAIYAAYVVSTVVVSHFGGIRRYGRVFFPAVAIWTPFYFVSYALMRPPLESRAPLPWFPTLRHLTAGAMMWPPDKEVAWLSSNGIVVIGAGSLA